MAVQASYAAMSEINQPKEVTLAVAESHTPPVVAQKASSSRVVCPSSTLTACVEA